MRNRAPMHIVAVGLQRILAEASRTGQRPDLYSFFIRRAREAQLEIEVCSDLGSDEEDRIAQILLILLHEAAHALPKGHTLHEAAENYAILTVSSLSNQWLQLLSSQLSSALGLEIPKAPEEQLSEWISFRDGLNLNDEQLGEAISSVSSETGFVAEIACDRVALVLQTAILDGHRNSLDHEAFLSLSSIVLSAIYRAFLHLRLLKYIDDVFLHLPRHILVEKINPLDLRSMVTTGFRGTLVGQLVLDAALEIGGQEQLNHVRSQIVTIQEEHSRLLFEPLNRLLEMTVLNAQFHKDLPSLLSEDGVASPVSVIDELQLFHDADAIWLEVIAPVLKP